MCSITIWSIPSASKIYLNLPLNSPPSSDAIAFGITILFNAYLNVVAVGFEFLLGVSIPQAYFEKI